MTRSVRLPYPYPIEREPASLPPPPPGREEHTAKPTMAVLVSVTVSTMKAPFMVAAVASRPCAKPSWPLLTLALRSWTHQRPSYAPSAWWRPRRHFAVPPRNGITSSIAVVCSMFIDQASCRAVSENAAIFVR